MEDWGHTWTKGVWDILSTQTDWVYLPGTVLKLWIRDYVTGLETALGGDLCYFWYKECLVCFVKKLILRYSTFHWFQRKFLIAQSNTIIKIYISHHAQLKPMHTHISVYSYNTNLVVKLLKGNKPWANIVSMPEKQTWRDRNACTGQHNKFERISDPGLQN